MHNERGGSVPPLFSAGEKVVGNRTESLGQAFRQHRTKTALRLSTTSAAPEGSALGVLFFRHSAQNSLDNRQVNYARFAHSDEKIDGASVALSLCGIAFINE